MTRLFDAKPFIIAEVGSNWRDLSSCLQSIRMAKNVGADAVKFQIFTFETLFGFVSDERMKHELPKCWLPELKRQAEGVGIEFMCTAFSPDLLRAVDPFVEVHKIASSDACWPDMLNAVKATGKPAIVSHGGKSDQESRMLMEDSPKNWEHLYCVAAYPADYVDIEDCWRWGGLSDHTLGYSAAVMAGTNARVLEKHFTAFPDLNTPDRPHSLTPDQFQDMVGLIRGKECPQPQKCEAHMLLRNNRRLIATSDLKAGDKLDYNVNYGAYRTLEDDTRGAHPFAWEQMHGKTLKVDVQRGKGIALGDCE